MGRFSSFAKRLGATPSARRALARGALLAALVFGIPLAGVATAEVSKTWQQHEQRLRTNAPDRLSQLCDEPPADLADVCTVRARFNALEAGSLVAFLLGAAVLTAVTIVGWASRKHRSLHARAIGRAPAASANVGIALTLIHGAIVVTAIWAVDAPLAVTIASALAIVVGAAAAGRRMRAAVRRARPRLAGVQLDRKQGARLYDRIEHLCLFLGAPPPWQIVVGLEPGVFTTDAEL